MADVKKLDDSSTAGTLNNTHSTATPAIPADTSLSTPRKVDEASVELNEAAVATNGSSVAESIPKAEDSEPKPKGVDGVKEASTDPIAGVETTAVPENKTLKSTSNEQGEKTSGPVEDSSSVREDGRLHRGGSNGYRPSRGGNRGGKSYDRDDRQKKTYDKPFKNYRENVKSDLTSLPESSDPDAIRKQVEFYFSDSNLLSDKHLFDLVGGHKNHAVSIEKIHSFKRMRHFQPFSAVVAALKESKTLKVVNDDTEVQRKVPVRDFADKPIHEIQKVYEDEAMARSVYVKGFGEEKATTQFDLEEFFAKYGSTNSVRLRRDHTRTFKGSVFVEFGSEETAKTFLALDPKPQYDGEELVIKSKKQYCDEKVDDIRAGKVEPMKHRDQHRRPQRSHRDHDDEDNRDWKERREEDRRNGFRDDRRDDRDRRESYKRPGKGRGGNRGRGKDRGYEHNRRNDHDRGIPKVRATQDGEESVSNRSRSRSPYRKARADKEAENESKKAEGTTIASAPLPVDAAATQILAETKKAADEAQKVPEVPGSPKKRKHEADDNSEVQGNEKKIAVET